MRTHYFAVAVLALTAICLSACASSDYQTSPGLSIVPTYIRMAPEAPPEARVEEPPILDSPQTQTWRPGYWAYIGGSWDWVSGAVVARPDPTAVWKPDRWDKLTYGWCFEPGYWQ